MMNDSMHCVLGARKPSNKKLSEGWTMRDAYRELDLVIVEAHSFIDEKDRILARATGDEVERVLPEAKELEERGVNLSALARALSGGLSASAFAGALDNGLDSELFFQEFEGGRLDLETFNEAVSGELSAAAFANALNKGLDVELFFLAYRRGQLDLEAVNRDLPTYAEEDFVQFNEGLEQLKDLHQDGTRHRPQA